MHAADALGGHAGPVLFRGPDAVGGDGAGVPDAELVQDPKGGQAPALLAGLVLVLGLGEVDVHAQLVVLGVLGHPLPQGDVGGVLRVDGGIDQNLPVPGPVPFLGQADLMAAVVAGLGGEVCRSAEVDAAAGEVGADARLQDRLGDGGGVHVHVSDGGHAAGDQLCQGQARPGLHGPVVQLGLGGEDPVVEPGL